MHRFVFLLVCLSLSLAMCQIIDGSLVLNIHMQVKKAYIHLWKHIKQITIKACIKAYTTLKDIFDHSFHIDKGPRSQYASICPWSSDTWTNKIFRKRSSSYIHQLSRISPVITGLAISAYDKRYHDSVLVAMCVLNSSNTYMLEPGQIVISLKLLDTYKPSNEHRLKAH